MIRTIAPAAALACLLSLSAAASDEYQPSIKGCQAAINAQLGVPNSAVRYNMEKVKTMSHYREFEFRVSAFDAASPIQGANVSCKARSNGEVLAVVFADPSLVQAVATH